LLRLLLPLNVKAYTTLSLVSNDKSFQTTTPKDSP